MNKEKELARQTVRLDKEFYKDLKITLYKNDISFQKLVENYLQEWNNNHKEV